MQVFFKERSEITPSIWEYVFETERPLDFEPGQYVDLLLNNVRDDARGNKRTFSITSQPNQPRFTFVVKHFALQSPYKQKLQTLQTDDNATITDSMGDLILPKSLDIPLVFIAGGLGIASYASMLEYLLNAKQERQIFLYYRLRAQRERLFAKLTSAYPLQFSQTILAPNEIQATEILATSPPGSIYYLSGSQGFVETLRTDMEKIGIERSQIIFDYYEGYTEI